MTENEKQFLLSYKSKNPDWNLLEMQNIDIIANLPSVLWKMINLKKMPTQKHQEAYDKLKNVILYLLDKCGNTFNTKMNKLLFYTDFLSYKQYGKGITGLTYNAIQYGPVPLRWDRVYSLIDDVYPEIIEFVNKWLEISNKELSSDKSSSKLNFFRHFWININDIDNEFLELFINFKVRHYIFDV